MCVLQLQVVRSPAGETQIEGGFTGDHALEHARACAEGQAPVLEVMDVRPRSVVVRQVTTARSLVAREVVGRLL